MGRAKRYEFAVIGSKKEASFTPHEIKVVENIESNKGIIKPRIMARQLDLSEGHIQSVIRKLRDMDHPYADIKLYKRETNPRLSKRERVNKMTSEERVANRRKFDLEKNASHEIKTGIDLGYSDEKIIEVLFKKGYDVSKRASEIKKLRQELEE